MDKYLKGKRVLVTGGCQGIGLGIVVELWRLGANVVAVSNQPENLDKLKKEYPQIEIAFVDLRDWDKTRQIIDSLGVFDALVNNAGIAIIEPFLECKSTSFDETISVNTRAIINVSQIIVTKMIQNGIKGSIVNISSQASQSSNDLVAAFVNLNGARVIMCSAYLPGEKSNPIKDLERLVDYAERLDAELLVGCDDNAHHTAWGSTDINERGEAALRDHVAYCASKGAVDAITRVMSLELGPHGIRTNTVNPTVILTDMGRKVWADAAKSQPMLDHIPLGRFGEVREVVNAVLFLLSDDSGMINGVHLPVDGGFLAT